MHSKFGRASEYVFDGQTGWASPEYSGGGVSSAGGGGVGHIEPPLVDFPIEYVYDTINTNIVQSTVKGDVSPILTDAVVKPVTPAKTLTLESIKQTIKDNPLPSLVIAAILGYLVLGKGGK